MSSDGRYETAVLTRTRKADALLLFGFVNNPAQLQRPCQSGLDSYVHGSLACVQREWAGAHVPYYMFQLRVVQASAQSE